MFLQQAKGHVKNSIHKVAEILNAQITDKDEVLKQLNQSGLFQVSSVLLVQTFI